MKYKIRKMKAEEYDLLNDFLYEAIFVPDGAKPPEKSILQLPELQVYTDDFGSSPHDRAFVAEAEGKIVGAAWARIMKDYGHMDDQTPSLAISLYKEYRGMGIGTALLKNLMMDLKAAGYERVSLSVQKDNYAVKMYEKAGFTVCAEKKEEYLMAANLGSEKNGGGIYERSCI